MIVMEALVYRYHGLTRRMLEILNAGELGTITRWRRGSASRSCRRTTSGGSTTSLAGGALKDAGCYTIHLCASPGVASDPVRGRVGTPMQRTGSACQVPALLDANLLGERGAVATRSGQFGAAPPLLDLVLGQPADAGEHFGHRDLCVARASRASTRPMELADTAGRGWARR